jgi:hypothetical protein
MENFIIKDGVKFYHVEKLEIPRHDDFFRQTGTVEFQGGDEPVGYFDEVAFQEAKRQHWENAGKYCENKAGYFCKCGSKCKYPKCMK